MLNQLLEFIKPNYFVEEENSFGLEYIENLKENILESRYLTKNCLNANFNTTLGFSVVFKYPYVDKVIEKFPFFEEYLKKTVNDDYNAYYLNPLILELNSKVDKHLDYSLSSYYAEIPTPKRVSVLYVDAPEMEGGNLILYKERKFIAKIRPKTNKLVYFNGALKHEITKIRKIMDKPYRISLVCEQYSFSRKILEKIPSFVIRSKIPFQQFLSEEN